MSRPRPSTRERARLCCYQSGKSKPHEHNIKNALNLKHTQMHKSLTYNGIKTHSIQEFSMFILIHKYIYNCRDKIDKNTYFGRSSSCNQLCCCNVPPIHMPVCSSISQQHCHPRAGHDSHKE